MKNNNLKKGMVKKRAPRNRTLTLTRDELEKYSLQSSSISNDTILDEIENRIINQDYLEAINYFPRNSVDLLILDPPYNLTKNYHGKVFKSKDADVYSDWFEKVIKNLLPKLKKNASIYVCSDWQTSTIVFPVLDKYFNVRNRITWEREKGRGAKSNWKNNTEDIWFCTMGDDYYFDVDSVKLKRKVLAPYKVNGKPKDWKQTAKGNFRLTHPSNIWTDITVPFWSMPENTDHPTQKPEKLIAKLILASSKEGDLILDPFSGSGTTAVTAKKLNRKFVCIEVNKEYCCWSLKRLDMADKDSSIQGYCDGVFWERNSLNSQNASKNTSFNSIQALKTMGYQLILASMMEIGLVYKGQGLRTWWISQFAGDVPDLSHPLVQEVIELHQEVIQYRKVER